MLLNVADGNVQRVLAFQAEYDFKCEYLNDSSSRTALESSVKHNSIYAKDVCGTGR